MSLRPLPPYAPIDPELLQALLAGASRLGQRGGFWPLRRALRAHRGRATAAAGLHLVQSLVDDRFEELLEAVPRELLGACGDLLAPDQVERVARRLRLDREPWLRRQAQALLRRFEGGGSERTEGGSGGAREAREPWDWTAWQARTAPGRIHRHPHGLEVLRAAGLPELLTVADVRRFLQIPTRGQLGYLLLASPGAVYGARSAGRAGPYRSFTIPKRSGAPREIAAPRRQLLVAQRRILRGILDRVAPHEAAHGFVQGRSVVTNAAPHTGRALVVKFDLKDFFPTISYWRVVGLFAQLGYDRGRLAPSTDDAARAVAPVLARLCCFTDEPDAFGDGHTPQGAPTSPAISNLVCRGLDARLSGIARQLGGSYTRYADDLSFSFPDEPANGVGRLIWWVSEIVRQEGFRLHGDKTRVLRRSQRQQITGVVVNDGVRVPRPERRRFRAILHRCEHNGLAAEARGRADFGDWLRGMAAWIHMVEPERGAALMSRVEAVLAAHAGDPEHT